MAGLDCERMDSSDGAAQNSADNRPRRIDDRALSRFILTLKALPGVGSRTIQSILVSRRAAFLSACELEANKLDESFARSLGNVKIIRALEEPGVSWSACTAAADEALDRALHHGLTVLNPYMEAYSQRMLLNKRFPPLLFVRGDSSCLNVPAAVAIVGTREPTALGARMGRRVAELLVRDDYVVLSGLARGCDTCGHLGALDAGGRTVAVLSTPVDGPVFPKENQALAERIVEAGGALVSEYPPGETCTEEQHTHRLVARDEWQPALADGIIACETSRTGGTNHALRHALATKTPVAAFDYRARHDMDLSDPRISGNLQYLQAGTALPLYGPETIEAFKVRMKAYRQTARNIQWCDSWDDIKRTTRHTKPAESIALEPSGQTRLDFS